MGFCYPYTMEEGSYSPKLALVWVSPTVAAGSQPRAGTGREGPGASGK